MDLLPPMHWQSMHSSLTEDRLAASLMQIKGHWRRRSGCNGCNGCNGCGGHGEWDPLLPGGSSNEKPWLVPDLHGIAMDSLRIRAIIRVLTTTYCNHFWWFGTFLIFSCILKSHPNWRIFFFRGVETTTQTPYGKWYDPANKRTDALWWQRCFTLNDCSVSGTYSPNWPSLRWKSVKGLLLGWWIRVNYIHMYIYIYHIYMYLYKYICTIISICFIHIYIYTYIDVGAS